VYVVMVTHICMSFARTRFAGAFPALFIRLGLPRDDTEDRPNENRLLRFLLAASGGGPPSSPSASSPFPSRSSSASVGVGEATFVWLTVQGRVAAPLFSFPLSRWRCCCGSNGGGDCSTAALPAASGIWGHPVGTRSKGLSRPRSRSDGCSKVGRSSDGDVDIIPLSIPDVLFVFAFAPACVPVCVSILWLPGLSVAVSTVPTTPPPSAVVAQASGSARVKFVKQDEKQDCYKRKSIVQR
jgi:hypothetical protein